MTKANYKAWHIDSGEFSDELTNGQKLLHFARYAILAPSGHNTQPWLFNLNGSKLELRASEGRILPYSGVQANEPYVSLGACIETLLLAALGHGYDIKVAYSPDKNVAATITLGKKIDAKPELLVSIVHRVSNRNPYDTAPLGQDIMAELAIPFSSRVAISEVSKPKDIAYVAKETVEATFRTFGDNEFRNELSKWVRNNLTKQFDGMPGHVQGIPTPPSMLAKHIIKRIDVSKDQAKKDSSRVLKSPSLLIISTNDDSKEALLDAGRLYARTCITAQKHGLATAGIGTAVIDPVSCQELKKHFKVTGKPVAIIRVGKAKKSARHTPRLPLEMVTS